MIQVLLELACEDHPTLEMQKLGGCMGRSTCVCSCTDRQPGLSRLHPMTVYSNPTLDQAVISPYSCDKPEPEGLVT